jgi:hypothetical protein
MPPGSQTVSAGSPLGPRERRHVETFRARRLAPAHWRSSPPQPHGARCVARLRHHWSQVRNQQGQGCDVPSARMVIPAHRRAELLHWRGSNSPTRPRERRVLEEEPARVARTCALRGRHAGGSAPAWRQRPTVFGSSRGRGTKAGHLQLSGCHDQIRTSWSATRRWFAEHGRPPGYTPGSVSDRTHRSDRPGWSCSWPTPRAPSS